MKEWWQMEMKILNELNEIVSHILDGTLLPWLASWKMKSHSKMKKLDYPKRIEK